MTAAISIDAAVFKQAAQVTSAFLLLIVGSLLAQGLTRVRRFAAARKRKEKYERAKDLTLIPFDRSVGNLLEWALPFLGFFWMSMVLTSGGTLTAGWVYVGFRALYPLVAIFQRGVGAEGARTPILVATVPAYIALGVMAQAAIKATL